jgi:phenylalanyl-tRNA synthetase beta subunit
MDIKLVMNNVQNYIDQQNKVSLKFTQERSLWNHFIHFESETEIFLLFFCIPIYNFKTLSAHKQPHVFNVISVPPQSKIAATFRLIGMDIKLVMNNVQNYIDQQNKVSLKFTQGGKVAEFSQLQIRGTFLVESSTVAQSLEPLHTF